MVTKLYWDPAYRIIPSRYPVVGIFDAVADPGDLDVVLLLEAATNPRVLEEAGELPLVRPADRISGPGSTPIMAAFTHTRASRFSDATFGVYYSAGDEQTGITETAFHRARFLREARLPNERLDMRVYAASISGKMQDVRRGARPRGVLAPDSYAASQAYGVKLYRAGAVDGIVYPSVRRRAGECVAVFRPRCVTACHAVKHLEYRFENYELTAAVEIT